MSSINKVILIEEYVNGASLSDVAQSHGISVSTARHHVLKAGVLRSRADAVRLAAKAGKLGAGLRGKSRIFTDAHKSAISRSMAAWGKKNATGHRVKPSGYREFTRGENKGRSEHVVIMEARIGRRLLPDECVHHIDGDKLNNDENNLALVTRSGHSRLHRREDMLAGNNRRRDENGRFGE